MGHDGAVPGDPDTPADRAPSRPAGPATAPPAGPERVVVGVGASRGCPARELLDLVDATLTGAGLPRGAVVAIASADVKADEPAVLALAATLGVPARFLPAAELAAVPVPTPSAVVAAHVGTPSVAEAAALLVAGGPTRPLLAPKRRSAHATCAIAAWDAIAAPPADPADAPIPTEVPLP